MQVKRFIIVCSCLCISFFSQAQLVVPSVEADQKSLQLYNEGRWKDLIEFGKQKLAEGIDFPLLQMRLGYSHFKLGNYAQSSIHYNKVSNVAPYDKTANYYLYLCNLYMNNLPVSRYYSNKLDPYYKNEIKLQPFTISDVEAEVSYKSPTNVRRQDAQYYKVGLGLNLGYNMHLQQSVASFNQIIDDPAMQAFGVINPRNITINQFEYYAKATITMSSKLQVLGGYHYVQTPFNNLKYNNHIGFAGLQVTTPYIHVKAIANFATISNLNYTQYDGSLKVYPLGNTSLYSITKGSYNDKFILSQVIGFKVAKNIWLEANTIIGEYLNFLDNDGLYLYNDIDTKLFKVGGSLYTKISKKAMLSVNYTLDNKRLFNSNINFNQHSITGGVKWTF